MLNLSPCEFVLFVVNIHILDPGLGIKKVARERLSGHYVPKSLKNPNIQTYILLKAIFTALNVYEPSSQYLVHRLSNL